MTGLPNWDVLKNHYPAQPAAVVFKQIGGKVEFNYSIRVFENACATRVSRALNYSGEGHKIPRYRAVGPNGKFEVQVSSGANKLWYIFRVKILKKYLTERYGAPDVYEPVQHREKLQGRRGIIIYEVSGWSDATGHADLWDGTKCVYQGYGNVANTVLFWEAPQ